MAKTRVADLIARMLVEHGITDCFMLTGGGAMHLNDAFGREKGLKKVFTHHEQAAAIAAEAYCRLSGTPAVVNVTTGPGGVNALNGVYGAYVDSIGMIVVSGQVKRETYAGNYPAIPLRQLGDQEVDIVSMVRGITKYAVVLNDPLDTRKVVEKAIHLARRGRPGPVWIDVPIDVQAAPVDFDALEPFDPASLDEAGEVPNNRAELGLLEGAALEAEVAATLAELCAAERPVVLVGAGVRISGQHAEFLRFVERLGVPVVTGWNAHDTLPNAHSLYVGRPGTVGDRGGNFAVQTADYVLVLGSRLNIRQISYNWQSFARNARVAMVEIDGAELAKPTLNLHRPIHADLRAFFAVAAALPLPEDDKAEARAAFLARSRERAARYPVVLPEYWETDGLINPYVFGELLFRELEEGDIIVSGDGTACVTMFQAANLKEGQRLFTNSGCASMGYDLPAAIGAYQAGGGRRIICLAGDGSIMMNLQELQTIVGQQLPVKIFVLNNDGYHSIRQSQQNHFPDNIVGCGPDSGLSFPNFAKLAAGFGLPSSNVATHADLSAAIRATLDGEGAQLCEVMIDKRQEFAPKLSSRRLEDGTMVSPTLEDLSPFLPREELAEAMRP
ncbi:MULTISPECIES: thiamine pyrophosphate-binding protein [Sphingomonas]|uniref:Acetolactate synthase-1/2/3 large subunit n=1 Tax=Sphingomonas trueperi TaxID=53317 RepID=A0A7X5XVX4_9SPHN|nr:MULTISPECIES: thiamine pyrophosphate-binding protein [Sphingomonas]NJB96326.1 acetolactate synthase-1/2/3 large subunit [Sphingomonas trueperi]RSV42518.1 thiamine pyrophosphate-binding protein [Sphingomonas sp. ABOLE]